VHGQVCECNHSKSSDVFVLVSPFNRSALTDFIEGIFNWQFLGEDFKCFGTIFDNLSCYIFFTAQSYTHKTQDGFFCALTV
jgi:hypothetical protein